MKKGLVLLVCFLLAFTTPTTATPEAVKPGIEVLLDNPAVLAGKKVGLITNQTGVTRDLTHDVDALLKHHVNLVAVYGPEHGVRGTEQAGEWASGFREPQTGLPVYNLYGKKPVAMAPLFSGVDVLLFDIQDVGVRFYTYISTMAYAMEAAAMKNKPFYVLDRPNPLGGDVVQGPGLDPKQRTFVGLYPIPLRHGMTIGELARLFNDRFLSKKADLHVIPMQGWRRSMVWGDTGLPWVLPSPNIPTPESAFAYAGTGLFEGTGLSEGRGTTRPFQLIGAPYVKPWELAARLKQINLPGVMFREAYFQPTFDKFKGRSIGGLDLTITDPRTYDPLRTALSIIAVLKELYPDDFTWRRDEWIDKLTGTERVRTALDAGVPVDQLLQEWEGDVAKFRELRHPYLLYGGGDAE
ncbi:MAG: DUF1343 domain-containing protein [Tumebacillaceae bacterium]